MKNLFIFLVAVGSFVAISSQKCPKNQEYLTCGICDRICNEGPVACQASCKQAGCYCKKGFYRVNSSNSSDCVQPSNCPAPCPRNEEYSYCVIPCNDCVTRGKCNFFVCNKGCDCKQGYYRDFRKPNRPCILASKCPATDNPPQCKINEVYKSCGGCDQVCNREPIFCTQDCSNPGCYCANNYVRAFSGPNSICIPSSSCPRRQPDVVIPPVVENSGPRRQPDVVIPPVVENSGIANPPKCQLNEVYNSCGGCDQICNEEPIACAQDCSRPGCYCQTGYVRGFRGNSFCIPESSCPRRQPDVVIPPVVENSGISNPQQCQINEAYSYCGGCDQICNEEPIFCTQDCSRPGCYCQKGYVRAFRGNSICIPESSCPRRQPDVVIPPVVENSGISNPQQCQINEAYSYCGGCDQICNEEPIFCTQDCSRPGCYCQKGYVRAFRGNSICIPESSCPQRQPDVIIPPVVENTGVKCGANEVYDQCGVGYDCEDYCGRGANACAYCQPGCYCMPGYIRDGPEDTAVCIPENQCPQIQPDVIISPVVENTGIKCGANEVYDQCGVGYDCEDYCGRGANACAYCQPGCYCMPGYIRDGPEDTAVCIPENQCPRAQDVSVGSSTVYQCGAYEVYDGCGVGYDCEDYCGRGANACAYCQPGCYCIAGYVRDGPEEGAVCIPKNQCPSAQDVSVGFADNTGPTYQDSAFSFVQDSSSSIEFGGSSLNQGPSGPVYQCGADEVYDRCGVGKQCEDYCGRGPNACAYCQPGCYCRYGFKRAGPQPNSPCIPENQCPRAQDVSVGFADNTGPTYQDSAFSFVQDSSPPIQLGSSSLNQGPTGSGPLGQDVSGGFADNTVSTYQDSDFSFGQDSSSPIQFGSSSLNQGPSGPGYDCRPKEVFDLCGVGPECEDYCGRGADACAYCQPGCYCKDGYVRAGQTNRTICVPKNSCPVAQKCLKNEEYKECGTACPNNCLNKNRVCSANCVAGCFCKKGFIRELPDSQTKRYNCIPENQCGPK